MPPAGKNNLKDAMKLVKAMNDTWKKFGLSNHFIKKEKDMKKTWIFLLMVTMISVGGAFAAAPTVNHTVGWTPPSTWSTGSPLNPATDIAKYNYYCGTTTGGPYTLSATISGGTTTMYTSAYTTGTSYCVITDVSVPADGGLESAYSNDVSVTVPAQAPAGCTTLTVIN